MICERILIEEPEQIVSQTGLPKKISFIMICERISIEEPVVINVFKYAVLVFCEQDIKLVTSSNYSAYVEAY